jgi:hypothetical protein
MPLSIGIVGLPNVGKSTLFQLITKKQVDCANYPFCTIDPNVGVVAVPDERVDKLAELTKSAKRIYNTVEFVDIAGLVKGASQGEGLGNKFLANIREVDAIVYVLRVFQNEKIINVQQGIDVLRDKGILETELILKDLETVEKRMDSCQKEARSGKKEAIKEMEVLNKVKEILAKGETLIEKTWEEEERKIISGYQLLVAKPRLYLFNGHESDITPELRETFQKNNWPFLTVDVLAELDASDLNPEERASFGLPQELKINNLIKESYRLLDLITFLTTGPDETRAWTLKRGKLAPQAGGVIHSDFEKGFIKAEVINWKKLLEIGGFAQAREKGLIQTKGKEYVVEDGDVIEIKSNA